MAHDGLDVPAQADIEVVELDVAQRAAAVDPTFLAVLGDAGVAARADLYLRGGVAQIEEVFTEPAARKQGLASALVRECIRRARRADAEVIFLIADADEWTVGLYRRLGFTDLHAMASFTR